MFQEPCAQPEVTILLLGGGLSSCRRTQRYYYVYSLRRNQDSAPRLYYCFLTAPPLFLRSLPSLISNSLNLPFGTQGKSKRLNESYFLQTRKGWEGRGRPRKDLCPEGPHRVLLRFRVWIPEKGSTHKANFIFFFFFWPRCSACGILF